jgi:hypothetical protein
MLPCKEGISDGRLVYGDDAAGPPLQKLKGGASLAELQQDYALFAYSPLFLLGGLEHNPVQEWINLAGHKQIVFIFPTPAPVLHIGKEPIWDHTLWAVEKEHWPSLSLHIGSIALIDRAKKRLTRVICQEIPISDVAAKPVDGKLPSVTITTFAVDSNLGCIAFALPSRFQHSRPYLKFYPPREETLKLANRLLSFDPNPYSGLQTPPWENNNETGGTPTPTK